MTFDVDDSAGEHAEGVPGTPVVLLHGWPQDRTAWADVVPGLQTAGLRTLAPDLRGYSPGARPPHWSDYVITELVEDVCALADAAGAEQVHLVGHDWGGALAWAFAARHPERVASLTVLSTPHPAAMAWAMRHGGQARHSWYMLLFAIPGVAPFVLRRVLARLLVRLGLPRDRAAYYGTRMRRPGAMAASLAWYRAIPPLVALRRRLPWAERLGVRRSPDRAPSSSGGGRGTTPVVPTTYVWGNADAAFGRPACERTGELLRRRAAKGSDAPVDALVTTVELDAGHWLPETRAADVTAAVLARVGGGKQRIAG